MRALIQRVKEASVEVKGEVVGKIGKGLVVLLGVSDEDTDKDTEFLANKIANLRIFEDEKGKFNLSLLDEGAEVLVISQFTLYADTKKGRRPSFTKAAPPQKANILIEEFINKLKSFKVKKSEGIFGAKMLVKIFNDGPVTILLESS